MVTASFALILLTLVLDGVAAFRNNRGFSWISGAAAALLLLTELAVRSFTIGFPALTGTYESLLFYAAFTALATTAYALQKKFPPLASLRFVSWMVVLVLLSLASSPLAPADLRPPVPALQSGWLVAHVALSFIGEAFFVISFAAALVFLVSRKEEVRKEADRITLTAVTLGWPVFSAGALVFGAVWAQNAWGRWWGWDPKETWALISWLVYTLYLHLRLFRKKSDRLTAWVAVIGFLTTLFTFLGVNFLLKGLHSYG